MFGKERKEQETIKCRPRSVNKQQGLVGFVDRCPLSRSFIPSSSLLLFSIRGIARSPYGEQAGLKQQQRERESRKQETREESEERCREREREVEANEISRSRSVQVVSRALKQLVAARGVYRHRRGED